MPLFILDRKFSLVSGGFGENDGGPKSTEDGLSVMLIPFILNNVYTFAFLVALSVLSRNMDMFKL